jgi:hypothetical protein
MATTTNYGWTTPNDTDLVKDGAAAIRTLGSSVDTTTKALNPSTTLGDIEYRSSTANTNTRLAIGTTGQVLTVAGGVPTWATSDDANAIQNAIVDAKGDLIAASAADTPARLAVGANGTVLTADSAEATGLKWATPASGSTFVGCSLYKNANQTVNNATNTAITFQSESYDTDGFHDTSTNTSRITIPAGKGGKYLLTGSIGMSTGANEREISVWKNGTKFNIMSQLYAENLGGFYNGFSYVISLVATDYIELYMNQGSGGSLTVFNGQDTTSFQASYLGA